MMSIDVNHDVLKELTLLDLAVEQGNLRQHEADERISQLMRGLYYELKPFLQDGKYGLSVVNSLSQKPVIVAPAIYDAMHIHWGDVIARMGREHILLYEGFSLVDLHIECEAFVESRESFIYFVRKNGKWGLFDSMHNDWKIKPEMDYIYWSDDEDCYFVFKDGQKTVEECECIVFPTKFDFNYEDRIDTNNCTYFILKIAGLWGLYDTQEKCWVAEPIMDSIEEHDDYFILHLGDKVGYVDHQVRLAPCFDSISHCRHIGYVYFYLNGQRGYIDKDGQWTSSIDQANVWRYESSLFNIRIF